MQHLAPNTLLRGGTYKIEKVLGQGSFGITYLAEHTVLGKKVCIKEFFMKEINSRSEDGSITGMSDGSLSYNYAQKFRKEAQNLAWMEHENIVRVTDSFDENGTYYYVMDYIDGCNLNDYLKSNTVSQEEAVRIITDVAKALMYMHEEKHVLHLDLKPGNIMHRKSDGHIFLIDFGLSKHYDAKGAPETSTTIGLGTPGYAPIEQSNQAKNGEFRPTIDVYALGATLYKLLTRENPPLASELVTDDELIGDNLKEHNVSESLSRVIINAMLPNVKKRTQTISKFVAMLDQAFKVNNEAISQLVEGLIKHAENNKQGISSKPSEFESILDFGEETEYISEAETDEGTVFASKNIDKHPDFDESTYKIKNDYKNYPIMTGNKANCGDREAMLALGIMALRGEGVQQDFDTAHTWFLKLKKLGDDRGEKLIGQWATLKYIYNIRIKTPEKNFRSSMPVKKVNGSTGFFTNHATTIMLVAALFFVYDIICYNIEYAPHGENLHTYYGYGILHNLIELSLMYTIGIKLLQCNKWYMAIATLGIVLWISGWSVAWNANYVWIIMDDTLTDSMADFSQFVSECSQYGGLLLIIAFLIGIIFAKNVVGKIIFVLLMIYAGTRFIPHYMNPEDINGLVISNTEHAVLLLSIALLFYSDKQNKET